MKTNQKIVTTYSTQEAAEKLGYTNDAYIRRLILTGKLPAQKLGRDWRITQEAINQYRQDHPRDVTQGEDPQP